VRSEPSHIVISKGDTVTLQCRGSGNPVPTITWTRRVWKDWEYIYICFSSIQFSPSPFTYQSYFCLRYFNSIAHHFNLMIAHFCPILGVFYTKLVHKIYIFPHFTHVSWISIALSISLFLTSFPKRESESEWVRKSIKECYSDFWFYWLKKSKKKVWMKKAIHERQSQLKYV